MPVGPSPVEPFHGFDDGIAIEAQGDLLVKGKTLPVNVYAVSVDSLVAEGV